MKVLHISTRDKIGGASIAAYRIHQAMLSEGLDSRMEVLYKSTGDPSVFCKRSLLKDLISPLRDRIDYLPNRLYSKHTSLWSNNFLPKGLSPLGREWSPDIINLHWINAGFVSIEDLRRFNCPIIWTLHDMWAFTGGCHYSEGCQNFRTGCGTCPQLGSNRKLDLSQINIRRKAKSWNNLPIAVVSPSKWLKESAMRSSIFKDSAAHYSIPYPIDLTTFRPIPQLTARTMLGLPTDKKLVLFGAYGGFTDKRKGGDLIFPIIENLIHRNVRDIEFVAFGEVNSSLLKIHGIPIHSLGTLRDDISLALAYSAADTFVAPSREDNLPNTVIEALACGTPPIAFNIGGMPDMITHFENGYLVGPFDPEDFAKGIVWALSHKDGVREAARRKAETIFAPASVVKQYLEVYNSQTKT